MLARQVDVDGRGWDREPLRLLRESFAQRTHARRVPLRALPRGGCEWRSEERANERICLGMLSRPAAVHLALDGDGEVHHDPLNRRDAIRLEHRPAVLIAIQLAALHHRIHPLLAPRTPHGTRADPRGAPRHTSHMSGDDKRALVGDWGPWS